MRFAWHESFQVGTRDSGLGRKLAQGGAGRHDSDLGLFPTPRMRHWAFKTWICRPPVPSSNYDCHWIVVPSCIEGSRRLPANLPFVITPIRKPWPIRMYCIAMHCHVIKAQRRTKTSVGLQKYPRKRAKAIPIVGTSCRPQA